MTDRNCGTCGDPHCHLGGSCKDSCNSWRPKEAEVEKKCETCRNRNLSFNLVGTGMASHPCWGCDRNKNRGDHYEPALPEKREGLTEQDALIAAKDGWEVQEELGSEEFWCKNVMGSAFRHRVYTYKITGRREGK